MRIALRTGAGRGAYELAGSQGDYSASDLFDKEMFYELTPSLVVSGYAVPGLRQGKPRINLDDEHRRYATHLYRLLAALLLLPKPIREFKKTSGDVLVCKGGYSMTVIKIDVVVIESFRTVVRPTELLLENAQGLRKRINFINRMSRIMSIWNAIENEDSELANLLRHLKNALFEQDVNHLEIEKAARGVFNLVNTVYDPLQEIELRLGINQILEIEEFTPIVETTIFGVDDSITPEIARIETVRTWRKVAARGAAAQRFSTKVKKYYQDTCLFTGQKLPKLKVISSAGVDAAHILPWASHGINSVTNGICLSKQCHWAFDAGVIKLSFDGFVNQYVLSIPDAVLSEAREHGFNLEPYQAIAGAIPRERLPSNTDLWPNLEYINALNAIMYK